MLTRSAEVTSGSSHLGLIRHFSGTTSSASFTPPRHRPLATNQATDPVLA